MRFGKKNKYPMPIPSHVKCSWLGGFPHPLVSRPPVDPDSWEMCVCCPLLLTISMGKKYRMFSVFSDFIGQFHETSRLRLFFQREWRIKKRYSWSRFSYCFTILNFSFFFFPLGMIRERNWLRLLDDEGLLSSDAEWHTIWDLLLWCVVASRHWKGCAQHLIRHVGV